MRRACFFLSITLIGGLVLSGMISAQQAPTSSTNLTAAEKSGPQSLSDPLRHVPRRRGS